LKKRKKNRRWRRLLTREKYGEGTNTWCDEKDVQQKKTHGRAKKI